MPTLIQVALGGALGAALRWLAGLGVARLAGPGFPLAILSINVLGSFLMGAFVVAAARHGAGPSRALRHDRGARRVHHLLGLPRSRP